MFIIVVAILVLSFGGAVWNWNRKMEHSMAFYQKRLAEQSTQIEELKDSIEFLNDKADVLLFTLSWLRDIDSAQVDSVVQILQSINKE